MNALVAIINIVVASVMIAAMCQLFVIAKRLKDVADAIKKADASTSFGLNKIVKTLKGEA